MVRAHRHRCHYTDAEEVRLLDMLERHRSYQQIARALHRTQGGIRRHAIDLGVTVTTAGGRTQAEVARLLGVSQPTVLRWREWGWLKAHKAGYCVLVDEDDLLAFLEDPRAWNQWRVEYVAESGLREWAREIRAASGLLPVAEVAARLCVTPKAVTMSVRRGRIRAVRISGGELLIHESELEVFGRPMRQFKRAPQGYALRDESLAIIRRDWGRRLATDIAADVGVSPERVGEVALQVLGLPALGRNWWRGQQSAGGIA